MNDREMLEKVYTDIGRHLNAEEPEPIPPDTEPPDSDVPEEPAPSLTKSNPFYLDGGRDIVIENYLIQKEITPDAGHAIYFGPGEYGDVTIRNCEFRDLEGFVYFHYDAVIKGNIVFRDVVMQGHCRSGVRITQCTGDGWIVFERCKVGGCVPMKDVNGKALHGSSFSNRKQFNLRIDECEVSGYTPTSPICLYQNKYPVEGYHHIELINNYVRDTNHYVNLHDLGHHIRIVGNKFIAKELDRDDPRWRYYVALMLHAAQNKDKSTVDICDNILRGRFDPKSFAECCHNNQVWYSCEDLPEGNIIEVAR